MSVNLYNKNTKTLTQVAGNGVGVAKFGSPIRSWLINSNNSATNAVVANYDGIAVGVLAQTGTSTSTIIEIDSNGTEHGVTACDLFMATAYINSVTFPVKKGCKYYLSSAASTPSYGDMNGFTLYPFVENIVQPIEGGEEYSEEEQVVGVYCDGKPVYKLTVKGYSGNGGVSLGSYNIKYPLKIEGFAKNYAGSSSLTSFPTFGANGETASLVFSPSQVIYRAHGFSYSYSDIDFTIWYTKTTD